MPKFRICKAIERYAKEGRVSLLNVGGEHPVPFTVTRHYNGTVECEGAMAQLLHQVFKIYTLSKLQAFRRRDVTKTFAILITMLSMALLGVACSSSNDSSSTNTSVVTETTTTNSATTSPTLETSPSPISNASAADDSSIETETSSTGVKTETRTFRNNARVSKVVVTTDKSGVRRARVYSPSGESRDLPESKVGEALSATGDALASSAGFVADKSKDAYKASKKGTEKAVDKTVDVSKTVGEKTADTSKDVADKTVDVSKTVGRKTAEGAKTVGEKTAEGAKKTGRAIKKAVTP